MGINNQAGRHRVGPRLWINGGPGQRHAYGPQWRLVYNGGRVLAIVEGSEITITSTVYTLEERGNKTACLARANALGLLIPERYLQ